MVALPAQAPRSLGLCAPNMHCEGFQPFLKVPVSELTGWEGESGRQKNNRLLPPAKDIQFNNVLQNVCFPLLVIALMSCTFFHAGVR